MDCKTPEKFLMLETLKRLTFLLLENLFQVDVCIMQLQMSHDAV